MKKYNYLIAALLLSLAINACSDRQQLTSTERYPADFDTLKFAQANENTAEMTILRIICPNLKPNGYFFGAPGILPNGDVSFEILRKSTHYKDTGFIPVYYKYLDNGVPKTDTFKCYL